MRLSTRARYGLRAVVDLAQEYGGPPVPLAAMAERQHISRKYLHAIMSSLKTAGLVQSVRGTDGGYVLVREPSRVTVGEVLEILEGSLTLVECVNDGGRCERTPFCVTREVWCGLTSAIENMLSGITLYDLVLRDRELRRNAPPMFHI